MQATTKANVYSIFQSSFVGKDGAPVNYCKAQIGATGERVIELALDSACYDSLIASKFTKKDDAKVILEIRQFGNNIIILPFTDISYIIRFICYLSQIDIFGSAPEVSWLPPFEFGRFKASNKFE